VENPSSESRLRGDNSKESNDGVSLENNTLQSDLSSACTNSQTKDSSEDALEQQPQESGTAVLLASYLNLALCCLHLEKNLSAMEACDHALKIDPMNCKGLYRRAMAHLAMDSLDCAVEDLTTLHHIDPLNIAALSQLNAAKQRLATHKAQQRVMFAGMFSRFAEQDAVKERERTRDAGDVFSDIGEWSNDLAKDMMTLEQEMAAFGEVMPQPNYAGTSSTGDCKDNEQGDSDYD